MPAPSVTLCLPGRGADAVFDFDRTALQHLASLTLRTNANVDGWTEANFVRRLEKLVPQRTCILILFVALSRHNEGPVVFFDVKSSMPLADLLDYVSRPTFCPTFMFLVVDGRCPVSDLDAALSRLRDAQFVCWTRAEHHRTVVAVGCEFSRWWGLGSLVRPEVTCDYVAERLAVLITRFNELPPCLGRLMYRNRMRREQLAWADGLVVVQNVDYDKFISGARPEQYADSLKRLADAAYAPRAQHQRPAEHLVSTQALFWFTELRQEVIDFDWLASSRLAFELFGSSIAGSAPDVRLVAVEAVTSGLVRAFASNFVDIPAGVYALGSSDDADDSEPPADRSEARLAAFRILKRPVTGNDWRLFSRTRLDERVVGELPVTHCNAFEALVFARLVERALREEGLIGPAATVTLPTERQWEAAARGPKALAYPWGDIFDQTRCNCNLAYGAAPTPPRRFSPQGDSFFGCQDMAGNVREWTRSYGGIAGVDWQHYDAPEIVRDLDSLQPSDRLVIRGGSYSYDAECARSWVRNTQLAARRDSQTGFRLAIEGDR